MHINYKKNLHYFSLYFYSGSSYFFLRKKELFYKLKLENFRYFSVLILSGPHHLDTELLFGELFAWSHSINIMIIIYLKDSKCQYPRRND